MLMGRGWNQDYFTDADRMPDRHDLDQVSEDVPVCAVRACGHCLVVNTKALQLLGITKDTPQPEGGCIGMDEEGRTAVSLTMPWIWCTMQFPFRIRKGSKQDPSGLQGFKFLRCYQQPDG